MSEKKGKVRALKYLNNKWVLIKDTGLDEIITSQAVVTVESTTFPMDRIKRLWNLNKRIVQVCFCHINFKAWRLEIYNS